MSRFSTNSRSAPGRFDPRRPQALADVLDRTDAFRALRAGVEQVAALQRDLTALLPDYLAANVEPGFIKDGVLALSPRTMRSPRAAAYRAAASVGSPAARLGGGFAQDPRASPVDEGSAATEAGAHVRSGRVRAARPRRDARAFAATGSARAHGGASPGARAKNERRFRCRSPFVLLFADDQANAVCVSNAKPRGAFCVSSNVTISNASSFASSSRSSMLFIA